jgi:hypothetical protein
MQLCSNTFDVEKKKKHFLSISEIKLQDNSENNSKITECRSEHKQRGTSQQKTAQN